MSVTALWTLDAGHYTPHLLHRQDRIWPETNCYVDLWIEILATLEADPIACLPFTLGIDFEGDQWTFFKPPPGDLERLYGIDLQELTIWRPIAQHIEEQVRRGRLVLAEADAFYLPDVAGTNYQTEHAKTTIAIQEISLGDKHIGYFHNGGYYALGGDDFQGLFCSAGGLPPYVEFVKLDSFRSPDSTFLVDQSVALLRSHLSRRPASNPFAAYIERFGEHMNWLSQEGLAVFHRYAFATLRQVGAACELAASYLEWLCQKGGSDHDGAEKDLIAVASAAKAFQFKIARAVNLKKPPDRSLLHSMESAWEAAMRKISRQYLK